MDNVGTVLGGMPFLTQPGIQLTASGLQDGDTDQQASVSKIAFFLLHGYFSQNPQQL